MATRTTQPYRRGSRSRTPGAALAAMLRGKPAHTAHPRDAHRTAAKRANRRTPARGRVTPYASLRGQAKRTRYKQAFKSEAQRRLIFYQASQGVEWARKWLAHKGMRPPSIRGG